MHDRIGFHKNMYMMNRTCGFAWLNEVQLLYSLVLLHCVELFSEDSKYIQLYKQHNDYSKIHPSFISIVLSLE